MQRFAIILWLILISACQRSQKPELFNFDDLKTDGPDRVRRLIEFDDGPQPDNIPVKDEGNLEGRNYTLTLAVVPLRDVAIDSAGQVLTIGHSSTARAARFDSYSYAASTGWTTSLMTIGTNAAFGITVSRDASAKIYYGGRRASLKGIVTRLNSNGTFDTSFATIGTRTVSLSTAGSADFVRAVVTQTDGKLLGAGYSVVGGRSAGFLFRLESDGSFDTSFATQGYAFYALPGQNSIFYRMALDSEGNIFSSGVQGIGPYGQATLWRVKSDGQLDTQFNTTGVRSFGLGQQSLGYSVLVDTTGKVYQSGTYTNPLARIHQLVRFNSDGSLDTAFRTVGYVTQTESNSTFPWFAPAVLADWGKIQVAFGRVTSRYTSNGVFDSAFYTTGSVMVTYSHPTGMAFSTSGAVWSVYMSTRLYVTGAPIILAKVPDGAQMYGNNSKSYIDMGYFPATTGTASRVIKIENWGLEATTFSEGTPTIGSPYSFVSGFPGTGGTCTATLPGFSTCGLSLFATTTAAGRYNDVLKLSWDYDGIRRTLPLTVIGAASNLSVTSYPVYNAGTLNDCVSFSQSFTVTNNGASSITLGTYPSCVNYYTYDAQIYGYGGTCSGATLGSGGTCTFNMGGSSTYTPGCSEEFPNSPDFLDECRFELTNGTDEGISLDIYGNFS